MTDLEKRQAAHCSRKKPFGSRAKAVAVAEWSRLEDVRKGKPPDPRGDLEVYKCSNCGLFHLGHPIKEKQKT